MSALTELRKRITTPDGHLVDRNKIDVELGKAIAAEQTAQAKMECTWCEGLGFRTVPDGEGHIIQEPCERCAAKGGIIQNVIHVLEGEPPFGPAPSIVIERLTVLDEVAAERQRQDAKWGQQNHDMADYYTILGEEFGEVGKAICESKLQKIVHPQEIRKELVRLAAVAVAMVEAFDRQEARP